MEIPPVKENINKRFMVLATCISCAACWKHAPSILKSHEVDARLSSSKESPKSYSRKMNRIHEDKKFSTMSVESKLANFLLKFSGNDVSNDTFLSSVTRKDIANAIGTTPESVMRTLSTWSKKGIISESDKKLKIIDFHQMKLISEDL